MSADKLFQGISLMIPQLVLKVKIPEQRFSCHKKKDWVYIYLCQLNQLENHSRKHRALGHVALKPQEYLLSWAVKV